MKSRVAEITRKTNETQISVKLNLDGNGKYNIKTDSGFFTHMLQQLSKHSLIDMEIAATGDSHIDYHHLVEDTGIAIGMALKEALGDKKHIERYGHNILPMDETVVETAIDLSNRPYMIYNNKYLTQPITSDFDLTLFKEFFYAIVYSCQINLYINVRESQNNHHNIEAIFKSFARALRDAIKTNNKIELNSTKGTL